MTKVKKIVLSALLMAILIVLDRLIPAVSTTVMRISFGYVPVMLGATILGPDYTVAITVVADIIGATLFPMGAFYPGFTLSALLMGLIHGLFLYNTKTDKQYLIRLILSTFCVTLSNDFILNTFWLLVTIRKDLIVFSTVTIDDIVQFIVDVKKIFVPWVSVRVITNLIRFPVEVVTMFFLKKALQPVINRFLAGANEFDDDDDDDSDDGKRK
jgi:ECF transporter S component (folate family)